MKLPDCPTWCKWRTDHPFESSVDTLNRTHSMTIGRGRTDSGYRWRVLITADEAVWGTLRYCDRPAIALTGKGLRLMGPGDARKLAQLLDQAADVLAELDHGTGQGAGR